MPVSSLASMQGCRRALCTVFPSSIHLFISYWDGDNRISAPSIQESAGREGNPLTLFPLADNGCVHARVWLCDFVIVWVCVCVLARWDQCLFQLRKSATHTHIVTHMPHSPVLILLLVCVQSSPSLYCLLASSRAVLTEPNITMVLNKYSPLYWLLMILWWNLGLEDDLNSNKG